MVDRGDYGRIIVDAADSPLRHLLYYDKCAWPRYSRENAYGLRRIAEDIPSTKYSRENPYGHRCVLADIPSENYRRIFSSVAVKELLVINHRRIMREI
jgi:hypothetical protein